MKIEISSQTVFYTVENAIKYDRKFAQKNISNSIRDMTDDQALGLQFLSKHPELTQNEIAELIFRDKASMTRMINTMVKNKCLRRDTNHQDHRRYKFEITSEGEEILVKLPSLISNN